MLYNVFRIDSSATLVIYITLSGSMHHLHIIYQIKSTAWRKFKSFDLIFHLNAKLFLFKLFFIRQLLYHLNIWLNSNVNILEYNIL